MVKIEYGASLAESPAASLVEAYREEIKRLGFDQGGGATVIPDNAWVAYAMDGEECIGFSAHLPFEEINSMWIHAAYVVPHRRGEGIHSKLFERVVYQAELECHVSVQCGTHVENYAAQNAFEKQGRKVFGLMYRYDLKKELGQ